GRADWSRHGSPGQHAPERCCDALGGRVEENAFAIVGRDQLRNAADVAGDEGNAVLETLVHGVRRVLLERGHDRQRARSAQPLERLVLVELRLERDASERALRRLGEQRLRAGACPGRGRSADELELEALKSLRLESIQCGGERLQPLLLVNAAEEDESLYRSRVR